ncbi:hypothetical protein [Streptomyces antibioticus]|uniref:hypothetical protein n=1 Tax=Streptomyces antibioticus TaxID=1890 RepID=UPI003D70C9D8
MEQVTGGVVVEGVGVATADRQQVLAAGPARAKKPDAGDRRGLTALFWSNVNPCGTSRLDTDARIALGPVAVVPRPRTSAGTAGRSPTRTRRGLPGFPDRAPAPGPASQQSADM